ncbi:MAG: cytosolic protein [bacterium]|nr:cytosolic protein [bacterium]
MKTFIVFSGTSPVLFLTTYPSIEDARVLTKLKQKGINKFIAFEVPVDRAKERYGARFEAISEELEGVEDLRVLDYNGNHAFACFHFDEMGEAIKYES